MSSTRGTRPTPPGATRRPGGDPTNPWAARVWGLLGVVVIVLSLLVGRLAQVQLFDHADYVAQSESINTREIRHPALRGRILAADGSPLVRNTSSTVVTIDPAVLRGEKDGGRALVGRVAEALGEDADELYGRTRPCGTEGAPKAPACNNLSAYEPVPVASGVDPGLALSLVERPERFAGVSVQAEPLRTYPQPWGVQAPHVLGYLGRVTADDLKRRDDVTADDVIGRDGLEAAYDAVLRGTPGSTTVSIDPVGNVTGTVGHKDPVAGRDLVTHISPYLQRNTEAALASAADAAHRAGRRALSGAAVVLNPRNGDILAAASYPSYDPGVWTGGISSTELTALTSEEKGTPLVNRIISTTYPPASTFKVVSLPVALASGVDARGLHECASQLRIGDRVFTNFESKGYGRITLQRAIEVSCDTVFYQWAYDEWLRLGGLSAGVDAKDPYAAMARRFGLGARTGVDLPNEQAGRIPDRAWKKDYWEATRESTCRAAEAGYPDVTDRERRTYLTQLAKENCQNGFEYRGGDAVNFSIGQGDVATTPLQMASVYATIANGGTVWAPRLAAGERDAGGKMLKEYAPRRAGTVDIPADDLRVVTDGLRGVMTSGTAAGSFGSWDHTRFPLAGKTGSAEVYGQSATSWFASYGPTTSPEYVVLVVLGDSGTGATYAAPAARHIWDAIAVLDAAGGPTARVPEPTPR